jgi:hypothetical protein
LGKADTAIQDVSGKADKVSGATNNDFAALDANGNLKDSGKKASDFATAAQGSLADSAYQKPSGGIPKTDLASAVQTSLGKADSALQSQVNADWNSSSGASQILNKPTIPDVSGLADKVMVVSASPQPSTYQPNKVYQLGTLTGSVTINPFAAVVSGDTEAKVWCLTFSTGSTAPTITWPAAITDWNGGVAPTIGASKSYELSVMGGIGGIIES